MAEEGSSSPLSSVLSSPPVSPPRSVSGDWNAIYAQEIDTAARVALEEIAAEESTVEEPAVEELAVEEPAVEEPAVEEPAVEESTVEEPAVEEPAVEEPAVEEPAVEESTVEDPAVKEPAVEEPVVKKPSTKKPATKKPATKKSATKKSAVEQGHVKESEVQGPEEPEGEPATPLAASSACPENKTEFRPSDQLEARQPEEKASTSWAAINLPPQKLRSVDKPEVPTREEEPTAPSAAPSSVPKKRKSLPEAVSFKGGVADSRNILKPKLTRGACTPCRENKLKCQKEKPICSRCSGSGTHCVYAFEQPRKGVSAAARPVSSKAEAVPADVGEPKALSPPDAHADSAVQDLEVEKEIATPAIKAATVADSSINGQGFKGPKNEDPSTVTKRARKRASGQTPEEAALNNDAWSSKITRHSGSSDEQLGTELGKRKASDQDKSSTAKRPRHAGEAPKKTNLDRKWGAPFVYTDEKSPLTNADLRAILLLPRAWEVLTPDERKDILAKFPDDSHILDPGTEIARPDLVSLRNNDHFRYDCARYLENIERGRHDEQWLQEAWVAHEKHKRGDYDDFLIKEFENDWATKIPEELLQKTSRKNETLETDATIAVSENKAITKEQHKALPGRTKSASVIQEVPPADTASVVMAETNTSHVADHHPNGHEKSNTNGARYTELRFEVPHEVD
ncbi:ASXH domain-containing protein [Neurospora hispaniola]|uniref:Asx homology domain-containing protein n=1 Tax=Neurospora hispaniola TaxID=588809 RepID=A0AAJ0MVL9_9PEZI|nr:Asx homology domain-containing protein [Neurospora hispaniola]